MARTRSTGISRLIVALSAAAMLVPKPLLACAVCMGASDSPVAPAINAAIFLLMGFIGSMLAGVGGFAFYLSRRAKYPHPPHEQFLNVGNDDNDADKYDEPL